MLRFHWNWTPLEAARLLYKALRFHNAKTLNIAGNGIYTLQESCAQEALNQWLFDVISIVHRHWPLAAVRSGGQTGVDLAGLVAAYALGVWRVISLLPRGYVQRGADKVDREHTTKQIRAQIVQSSLMINQMGLL